MLVNPNKLLMWHASSLYCCRCLYNMPCGGMPLSKHYGSHSSHSWDHVNVNIFPSFISHPNTTILYHILAVETFVQKKGDTGNGVRCLLGLEMMMCPVFEIGWFCLLFDREGYGTILFCIWLWKKNYATSIWHVGPMSQPPFLFPSPFFHMPDYRLPPLCPPACPRPLFLPMATSPLLHTCLLFPPTLRLAALYPLVCSTTHPCRPCAGWAPLILVQAVLLHEQAFARPSPRYHLNLPHQACDRPTMPYHSLELALT